MQAEEVELLIKLFMCWMHHVFVHRLRLQKQYVFLKAVWRYNMVDFYLFILIHMELLSVQYSVNRLHYDINTCVNYINKQINCVIIEEIIQS